MLPERHDVGPARKAVDEQLRLAVETQAQDFDAEQAHGQTLPVGQANLGRRQRAEREAKALIQHHRL